MKKLVLAALIFALVGMSTVQVQAQQKIILQGGVSQSVPKTPSQVQNYLVKMKGIMGEYDALSQKLMPIMMMGNTNKSVANSARNEWVRLARKIQATTPPQELKYAHINLAKSLNRSSKFLIGMAGANASQKQQVLNAMVPIVQDLQQSTSTYSANCSTVIASYGLDPSLNPLGANGAINGNAMAGMGGMGALGGMGGMGGMGALQGLMGGSGGASMLQGIDLNALQNLNGRK